MKTKRLIALFSVCALFCAFAWAQTAPTSGDRDRLQALLVNGKYIDFEPLDPTFLPVNAPIASIAIDRTGDGKHTGIWVPVGSRPATLPATKPVQASSTPPLVVPPVVVPPAVDPNIIHVAAGESWIDGVMRAKSGQTVLIAAGEYKESWRDLAKRPAPNVKILGAGIGRTRIIAVPNKASPAHVYGFRWTDIWIEGISFLGGDTPTGAGVHLLGSKNVTLKDCQASGFTIGLVVEASVNVRSDNIVVDGGSYSDNWHPKNLHSHGFYVDKTDRLRVLNATIARNGHNPAAGALGTEENHGGYITGSCGPAVVTGCTIEDNSAFGLQARSGGSVTRNTFRRNPTHLSFGLVNGNGPLYKNEAGVYGVSGSIMSNKFVGTRLLKGNTPRGIGITVGNVGNIGLIISHNEAFDDGPAPSARIVPSFAFIRLDRCVLGEQNPDKGKDVGVKRLTVEANAVTWPEIEGNGKVWINKQIAAVAAKPKEGAVISIQAAWPAALAAIAQ